MKALITLNYKIKNSITPSYNTLCTTTVAARQHSLEIYTQRDGGSGNPLPPHCVLVH